MENPTKLAKNVQQYIELVYSEKSDLNHIADLEERKKVACDKVKLDYSAEKTKEIIHLKNEDVNTAIFEYLRKKGSNKYILLLANQQLYWEQMQKLMEPLKGTDDDSSLKEVNLKNTISEKSEHLLERIEKLYLQIFKEQAVIEIASGRIRAQRPEERLKMQKSA